MPSERASERTASRYSPAGPGSPRRLDGARGWPEKEKEDQSVTTAATATNSQTTTSAEYTDSETGVVGGSREWGMSGAANPLTGTGEAADVWDSEIEDESLDEFPKGYV